MYTKLKVNHLLIAHVKNLLLQNINEMEPPKNFDLKKLRSFLDKDYFRLFFSGVLNLFQAFLYRLEFLVL